MLHNPFDDEREKRNKAMQSRLKKLDTDNPVVKKAIKKNQPRRDEEFDVVNELVSAAFSEFSEGDGSLKESMLNLSKAISSASGKIKGSSHNSDHDDDFD